MKKTIIFTVVVLLVLTFVRMGNALTITVDDDPDPDVYLSNSSYTPPAPNPFDLTAQLTGYTVTSANLIVALTDDPSSYALFDSEAEDVKIMVDTIEINDEVGDGFSPNETYYINVLSEMNDNKLILTVQSVYGDFYYKEATLEVTYTPIPASVLLLGSGILGLGAVGWRRRKRG